VRAPSRETGRAYGSLIYTKDRRQVLGDGDADGHCLLSAASRLLPAAATPRSALTVPDMVLALKLEARSFTAAWSFASESSRAPTWACHWPWSSVLTAPSFALTSARSALISFTVPFPTVTCLSLSSEARSAATSWHSAEAGLAAGVKAAGVDAAGVDAAGDDGAAEVVLPGALAAPDEVLLDPQATVTSPAASATAQTFQADRTSAIRLMPA